MKENFLEQSFIRRYIRKCKHIIRKEGDLHPSVLVEKAGLLYVVVFPVVDKKHPIPTWVEIILRTHRPDQLAFAGTAYAAPPSPEELARYKRGDVSVREDKKENLVCVFANVHGIQTVIYEIKRKEGQISFKRVKLKDQAGALIRLLSDYFGTGVIV